MKRDLNASKHGTAEQIFSIFFLSYWPPDRFIMQCEIENKNVYLKATVEITTPSVLRMSRTWQSANNKV